MHQRIDLLRSFKRSDQIAFLVIEGQVGEIVDLEKWNQEKFLVPSYFNIGVIREMIVGIEFLHFAKGLVSGHDDLDILEFFEIGQDALGLVLAMLAVRAKEHDHRKPVFFQVILCQKVGAVHFQ